MSHRQITRHAAPLAALLVATMLLGGCVIRRTRPVAPPPQPVQPVVVAQPVQPVVVTQPVQPIVVTQPAPPVIVTQPRPVVVTQPAPAAQVSSGAITYPSQRVRLSLPVTYSRVVSIYVDGHGLDPTVAVYNGYGARIGFNDDGGSGLDSQLTLSLAPGSYIVEVAGYHSSTGSFTLSIQ